MPTIHDHIDKNKQSLDDFTMSSQRRRHIENELLSLENYRDKHPENTHDPTPLELFCDEHPDALECRMYEN